MYEKPILMIELFMKLSRQGIGSLLMEEAAMMAKEKGAAYVDFTARPRRTESKVLRKIRI